MDIPSLNTSFEPAKEDLLNFKPYAEKVQNIIRGLSNSAESIVIGIDGKWGSGKSTFSNMLFKDLESFTRGEYQRRIIKMRYNPWLYSGSDEMLFDFLNQMKKSFFQSESSSKKIGEAILRYSKYLKSVKISGKIGLGEMASLGVSVEPEEILKRLGEDLANSGDGLIELKERVNELLEKSDFKLVVFIDDLDRLDKDELFTILKLIKLTAGFQHVVFVVCMDFDMVANSIYHRFGTSIEDGQKYLEKIVNIPISLPLIESVDRKNLIVKLLDKTFTQYPFIDSSEKNLLQQSLYLCDFQNPREAIRIVNSFTYSLFAIGNEVNAHDLFWIEYIKLKCPALFNELKTFGMDLSSNIFLDLRITLNDSIAVEKNVVTNRDRLLQEYKKYSIILDKMFPADNQGTVAYAGSAKQEPLAKVEWEKRISHANHYEKYFSFHTSRKISVFGLRELIKNIENGEYSKGIVNFNKLKEEVENDVIVLRSLIEKMRKPIETGKTPIELFHFLKEYKQDCELNESENIGIYEVVDELVAGLEETDIQHFEIIELFCKTSNLKTSLSFANLLVNSFSNEIAEKSMKAIKERIINFREKSYFELLDYNPYYFHQYWSENYPDELEGYLLKKLVNLQQIGLFLKLFVNFWGGQKRGQINYLLLADLIKPKKLTNLIKQIKPSINIPESPNRLENGSVDINEQLAQEFLFWASLEEDK